MPIRAKIYIYAMVVAAGVITALSATNLQTDNPIRLAAYLALTAVTSTLKIRLPKLTSSVTPGFLFVLLAVADFSLAETSLICLLAGLVQTLWRPKRKPAPIQVAFNAATITVSGALAHLAAHSLLPGSAAADGLGRVAAALVILFFANIAGVSIVLCLIESKSLSSMFRSVNYWAFPYYLAGTIIALVLQYSAPLGLWALAYQLPMVYFAHAYFREYVTRQSEAT